MKKFYILLAFFASTFFFSQVVNIPDANFKTKLLSFSPTVTGAFNSATTTVQNILSTNEAGLPDDFTLYPNPVKDILNFRSKEKVLKAEIFDSSGRIIRSVNVSNNATDLSDLSKGIYMIKVYTADKIITRKSVKN